MLSKLHKLLVIGLYLILTLIMTVPVIFNINSEIPINPNDNDALQLVTKVNDDEARLNLESFSDYLYFLHPQIIFNVYNYLLILHLIFNEPLAYNIIWLASFVLAGFGAYILVEYFTKSKISAFIAGLVYTFSHYHFIYAVGGHFGATHIEFIPFFVLFLIKYFRKPKFKNFILTLVFFLFVIRSEPHYAAFTLLFLILFAAYYLYKKKYLLKDKRFITYGSIAIIGGLILMIWFYLPLIKISSSDNNYLAATFDDLITASNDIVASFTPPAIRPVNHLFFGDFFSPVAETFTTSSPHIGFTVIFFLVFAYLYRTREVAFWLLSGTIFYILSLGPFLHFMGTIEPKIPMPYLLLYEYVPWFDNIRMGNRTFVIALLSIAVLSGFGIKYFLEKYNKNKKSKYVIPLLIISVLLLEFFVAPIKTTGLKLPDFYKRLSQEEGDFSILQIPGSTSYAFANMADYYQSIHDKNTINDYDYARVVEGRLDFQQNTPVISDLLYAIPNNRQIPSDIINHPYQKTARSILDHYDIKYLIIHKDYFSLDRYNGLEKTPDNTEQYLYLLKFIKDTIGANLYFEDNDVIAFKVPKGNDINPYFLTLGSDNWLDIEETKQEIARWPYSGASLNLNNLTNQNKNFKLDLAIQTIIERFREVKIFVNDEFYGSYIATPKKRYISLYLNEIPPGENHIRLDIADENGRLLSEENNLGENKYNNVRISDITYKEVDQIIIPPLLQEILNKKDESAILPIPLQTNYSFSYDDPNIATINGRSIITPRHIIRELPDNILPSSFNLWQNNLYLDARYNILGEFLDAPTLSPIELLNNNYEIFNRDYYQEVIKQFPTWYNLGHIVLYKEFLTNENLAIYKKLIDEFLDIASTREDDRLIVYQLNQPSISKYPLFLGENWNSLSSKDTDYPNRWIFNGANLTLLNYHTSNQNILLSSHVWICNSDKPRLLKVYLNGENTNDYTIAEPQILEMKLPNVKPGENVISFEVLDKNSNPIDDLEQCTVSFSNLKVE